MKNNPPNVAKATAHPPANPFSAKKEIRRGEISEKGKGGGWWGASAHGGQAARLRVCGFSGNGFGFRRKIASKIKSMPVLGFIFGYDSVMELNPHAVRAKRSLANIPVLDGT